MNLLTLLSLFYFILTTFSFANAQTVSPAFEIFQREVYPFLQERCAECHGKNQFSAPQHSPIDNPQASYTQILGYVQLTQDWEQSSRLISFGGTRHCQEYLGSHAKCGTDRAELLSIVRNWIDAEITARTDIASKPQVSKNTPAKELLAKSGNVASSNQNISQSNKSLKIIQIATGESHTCALFENKKAKCWGLNDFGQLGIGPADNVVGGTPQEMTSLPYVMIKEPILQIAAGISHTCALLENKKMKCWGHNSSGQLGIGSGRTIVGRIPQEMESLPYVMINEPISRIFASRHFTCALLENKKAKCWGNNEYGKLGLGIEQPAVGLTPQEMKSLPYVMIQEPILQIATGSNHVCALLENKKAKCWGNNRAGQLGIGSIEQNVGKKPNEMQQLPDVLIQEPIVQLSVGGLHTCALFENKKAKCWGSNTYNQIGVGSNEPLFGYTSQEMQSLPYISITEPILQIMTSSSGSHTCALIEDQFKNKKAKCWGYNRDGQLGIGLIEQNVGKNPDEMLRLPYVVISANISQMSASYYHTCFLLENGRMKCAGSNDFAQLGTGDANPRGIVDYDSIGELTDALVTAQEEE